MLPAVAEHWERVASPPAVARFEHAGVALIRPALRAMMGDDRENRSTRSERQSAEAKVPVTSITSITLSENASENSQLAIVQALSVRNNAR
jgi:hypothetical protein